MTIKRLKALSALLLAALLAVSFSACGRQEKKADAGLNVVCSIFPVYDFTRIIAGDKASVRQLLPPGADSHGYEPSVGDMVYTDSADLFIYTDSEMEVWIDSFSGGFTHVKLIRCAAGIDLEELNEEWEQLENHDEEEEHGHVHKYDAHIWLDPTLAAVMCENILAALIEADPENEESYRANCARLTQELRELDEKFSALFAAYPDAVLYFGGKFSYSHFIRRYGVEYASAYDGCSEQEDVNLRELIDLIDRMKLDGAKYVFTDELSNGLIAEEIARETGAQVLLFHSGHNVSSDDKNASYTDIMNRNYDNILKALSGV